MYKIESVEQFPVKKNYNNIKNKKYQITSTNPQIRHISDFFIDKEIPQYYQIKLKPYFHCVVNKKEISKRVKCNLGTRIHHDNSVMVSIYFIKKYILAEFNDKKSAEKFFNNIVMPLVIMDKLCIK